MRNSNSIPALGWLVAASFITSALVTAPQRAGAQDEVETLETLVAKYLSQTPILPPVPVPVEIDAAASEQVVRDPSLKPDNTPETPTQTPAAPQSVALIYQTLPRYRDCLQGLRADLASGHQLARQWVSDGGGAAAHHCLAIADLATGTPKIAAVRLQNLAENPSSGDPVTRSNVMAQAAEIWLGLDQPVEAIAALQPAFSLSPGSGDLHLLAGRIHANARHWQSTIDAISRADELGFVSADGYVARARAFKELTQFDDAADDITRTLHLEPFNLDALVLRGELAQAGVYIETNFRRIDAAPKPTPTP